MYAARYPGRYCPTNNVFTRLERRTRTTGSLLPQYNKGKKLVRPVRDANAPAILAAAIVDPQVSQRTLVRDSGLSKGTVSRIFSENKWHPFHLSLHQDLHGADFANRVAFCNFILAMPQDYYLKVLWSDEATFKSNGNVNLHNAHYWSPTNPHWMRQVDNQRLWSLNVWCGIVGNQIVGPHFFQGTVTGPIYTDFLKNVLPLLLQNVNLQLRQVMWFQHDGAPPHFSRICRAELDRQFGNSWIGRSGPVAWPPRSPDLTVLDYYFWGRVKEIVYSTKPSSKQDMKMRIESAIASISPEEILRAQKSIRRRIRACLAQNGGHFEHL